MLSLLATLWGKIDKYLIAVGAALGVILGAYLKGKSDQKNTEKNRELDTLREGKKIDEEVNRMPITDIDRNLKRWMRD